MKDGAAVSDQLHLDNVRLSQMEYEQRRIFLRSRPRCLGVVLGNSCNIDCKHCYQSKDGSNLLRPPEIAREFRRELMGFYPYISTLRLQGGEVFALRGFSELIDDVAQTVDRPVLSISTNATLIDEAWAERLVRTPFSNITVSIDGGTRDTFHRLRQGADFDEVLANVDRIQRWKAKLQSPMPYLDSFFVVMRSNFREIPQYLELMRQHGFISVALQTMELSRENTARVPSLEQDELIAEASEVRELHAILSDALPRFRSSFKTIQMSGLQTLFETHGLGAQFLSEGENNLYPNSEGLASGAFELCPNPWTTLFVVENGDVHLCFISEAIGNLYEEPLPLLWNSPKAMAKRSDMIAGRYMASGCSRQYCGWREGNRSDGSTDEINRQEWNELVHIAPADVESGTSGSLALVRKTVAEERRKRAELEVYKRSLESSLAESRVQVEQLLEAGQRHIDHLEAKAEKAVGDFERLEAEWTRFRSRWLIRAIRKIASVFKRNI